MKSLRTLILFTILVSMMLPVRTANSFFSQFLDQLCIQFVTTDSKAPLLTLATTMVDDQNRYWQFDGKLTSLDNLSEGGITGSAFITTTGANILSLEANYLRSGTMTHTHYHFNFALNEDGLLIGHYFQSSQLNSFTNNRRQFSTGTAILSSCSDLADLTQFDLDGDGYYPPDDCDNSDPLINPASIDVPYDGIDNDCNPATYPIDVDQDGDGYTEQLGDCDDSDSKINPGATDPTLNEVYSLFGIDLDCNPSTYPVE